MSNYPNWIARSRASSCANDWTVPPVINTTAFYDRNLSDTTAAEEAYAKRATGDETEDCGCAPCGSKITNIHGGYWRFMASPGAFCSSRMHTPQDACGTSFASLARGPLRGKRVLIYGESVMMQALHACARPLF